MLVRKVICYGTAFPMHSDQKFLWANINVNCIITTFNEIWHHWKAALVINAFHLLVYHIPFPSLPSPLFLSYFLPLSAKCRRQIADCKQGTKCRLQTGYKMQTENLNCFFIGYIITSNLTIYRASLNRFSAVIVLDDLHYCGIFLACFLITIVLDIMSSLHIVF